MRVVVWSSGMLVIPIPVRPNSFRASRVSAEIVMWHRQSKARGDDGMIVNATNINAHRGASSNFLLRCVVAIA